MLKKGEDEIEGRGMGGGGKMHNTIQNFEFWVSPEIKIANWTAEYLTKPFVALDCHATDQLKHLI